MKKIAILGSTGSIGTQTLEVIRENKDIEVTGLGGRKQYVDLLEKQIREFQPRLVAMSGTEEKAKELKSRIAGSGCKGCFRNGWTSGDCHDGGK